MARAAITRFARTFQISFGPPVNIAELDKLAATFKFSLPQSIRDLYSYGDGGLAGNGQSSLELLSVKKAARYPKSFFTSLFGYFPVAENNDSNPICVCCKPPLEGYVVQVFHDDAPRLLFRSLEDFYRATEKHIAKHKFLETADLPAVFQSSSRTDRDIATSHALIELARSRKARSSGESADALCFACDLFSDRHVDEIIALLDEDDSYVREHVTARLRRLKSPKAKQALSDLDGGFDAFVDKCADLLSSAGVKISVLAPYDKKTIRVDVPRITWLNMEHYFDERDRADFDEYFVGRVKETIRPRKRSK